jgi:phage baseplate assembly protein V
MNATIRSAVSRALAGLRWAFVGTTGAPRLDTDVQQATVDGLVGETLPDVELWQHFGFTSAPPAGTHAIVLPLGGRSSASVIIATEAAAYRLQLTDAGEVAIYNQDGDHVWLKRGGHIAVHASTQVQIDAPNTTIAGNLEVQGNVTAQGNVTDLVDASGISMAAMRLVHNAHVHPIPGGSTGATPQVM